MNFKRAIILGILLAVLANITGAWTALAAGNINDLLPTYKTGAKTGMVANLPQTSWPQLIANVIKFILQIAGVLAALAFTVGGINMVTAQGNDEKIKKGRNIILYSLMALVILAVSYAIVLGITQLKFAP